MDTQPIHVFVQLTEPAVAEINIAARQSRGALASRADQQRQIARIEAQQSGFRNELASLGVTELGTQRIAANGFRLRIRPDQLEARSTGAAMAVTLQARWRASVSNCPDETSRLVPIRLLSPSGRGFVALSRDRAGLLMSRPLDSFK